MIINMAEKMKDAEDLKLESLFASEPVLDNDFSKRIEKRIRRQIWLRRLTLPIAVLVGGAIAVKPLAGLVTALMTFLSVVPANISSNLGNISTASVPHMSTIVLGGTLVLVVIMITRMLED